MNNIAAERPSWQDYMSSFSSVSPELLNEGARLGGTNGNTLPVRGVYKRLSDVDCAYTKFAHLFR